MPKVTRALSPLEVKRLHHPGTGRNVTFAVDGVSGLLLQITPTGGRSRVLRIKVGGRGRSIGLGSFPDVSLAQARDRARVAKDKVWQGVDPVEERKAARVALVALPRFAGNDLVFPAPRGGDLSDATLGKVMRMIHEADVKAGGKGFVDAATGAQAVPHGLGSCFRTWGAERTRLDGDMAGIALFHRVGSKVQQACDRSDQVEKRRSMMAAWGRFLQGAQVVELQGARA